MSYLEWLVVFTLGMISGVALLEIIRLIKKQGRRAKHDNKNLHRKKEIDTQPEFDKENKYD